MTSTFWFTPIFILIWSTGFIIARYGMPYSEPMTFLAIRFGAVVLCMIPIVLWLKAPWPRGRQIWHIAIAGALFQFGYLGGVWAAVKLGMPAGLALLQMPARTHGAHTTPGARRPHAGRAPAPCIVVARVAPAAWCPPHLVPA